MQENTKDRMSVYEIGYLIASVPEEQVPAEVEKVRTIITDAGSSILAEEAPHKEQLSYTMRVKSVSGSYQQFDEAYFGWFKFEVGSDKVEAIKKSVELLPSILRMLLITTVKENTYLGKRATSLVAAKPGAVEEKKDAAPATIEDMDKSIDEMVKEV